LYFLKYLKGFQIIQLNEVMENPGRLRDFLKRKQKECAASGSSKPMHRLVSAKKKESPQMIKKFHE
jgi:hypothetical protein